VLDLSLRAIAAVFGLNYLAVGKRISETRKQLAACAFIQSNIGFNHLTRQMIIQNHTTDYAEEFYGDSKKRPVVVLDGESRVYFYWDIVCEIQLLIKKFFLQVLTFTCKRLSLIKAFKGTPTQVIRRGI
jgi:hypothetical protein